MRLRFCGLWLLTVLAMAGTTSGAQLGEAPVGAQGSPAADTGYFQIVRPVDKGVWLLAEPKFQLQPIGNVTVIEQRDGLVLVDAGGSPGAGRRIVAMVKSLSAKPVKAVIVTQWHGDKPQGLTEILKEWPAARTIATSTTQAHLRDPATMNTPALPDAARNAAFQAQVQDEIAYMRQALRSAKTAREREGFDAEIRMLEQYALDMDGALTIATKEGFDDRLELADPERPVEARFLGRANTDGDAVVWLPKQKIVVAGEIVILPFPYGFESYPSDWLATLAKLRPIQYRLLIPGHGMPQTDRVQLDRIAAALKDVRAQVTPLAAQGLSLDQVRAKVDLSAEAKTFVGDDPWLRRWFDMFFAAPIVASAYKESRGEPIVQNLKG
ncbi:MAG: MBL fold metallo-hydrolase [Alphaproteobacteria bacterium]|nr:MBL fold metallo-hydrolase [Alphaproteobacteria bacterium]